MRQRQDHYFRLAKAQGYLARAAYKLIEIDDRRRLLRRGDRVLDLGCWPGSWLQVAAARIGPGGRAVGIDLKPVEHRFESGNVRCMVGDVRDTPDDDLLALAGEPQRRFDVVLSDLAPHTSGDRSVDHHGSVRLAGAALDRCATLLRPGGAAVIKVFEGETYRDLLARAGRLFETARGYRPRASRSESTEMYIIGQGFRGEATRGGPPAAAGGPVAVPQRQPPATGWRHGSMR
jgi:23S rRNA (uridine2552-2'-O)-methyltransferase